MEAIFLSSDTVFRTMLFDFYGELLTDKQREYFDLHFNEDLTLAEIAEMNGISRQGVWDIIRRAENTLRQTEEKTGLIRRFEERRAALAQLELWLSALLGSTDPAARETAARCLGQLRALIE